MKKIIVDNSLFQTRIVLVHDGEPVEMFYESRKGKSIVGNIYAGRVENCIKGMQACFVDIGIGKNGYLPLKSDSSIKNGDTVVVQVEKDAFGSKGVVLTEKLSFTGKFAVIMLNDKDSIGISKKIINTEERKRIFDIVTNLGLKDCAAIIRTEGEGRSRDEIEKEINYLYEKAEDLKSKSKHIKPPALIFEEEDFVIKNLKNIFTSDIDEVVVNNGKDYENIKAIPEFNGEKVKLYEGAIPIFDNFYIESKIDKLFTNKIWLKSGGFIIIEQTEACVVIDVNTGKYTGKKNTEETFLKTNIEAAEEIARQLRLRNLSGMIIVDFIDMKKEENREILTKKLQDAVKTDRLKTTVVGMTELGLMQMTRKKGSLPVLSLISSQCYTCQGRGITPSAEYVAGKILREVINAFSSAMYKKITICAGKKLISFMKANSTEYIKDIEKRFGKKVVLEEIETAAFEYYELKKEM